MFKLRFINTTLKVVIFGVPIFLVFVFKFFFVEFDTADYKTYSLLYEFSGDLRNVGVFYFKYDPLFFYLMRIFNFLGLSFENFHVFYVFISGLIFVIALSLNVEVVRLSVFVVYCAFVTWLAASSYIDESFRTLPVALLSGIFLSKAFSGFKSSKFFFTLPMLHWSFIIMIFLRKILNRDLVRLLVAVVFIGAPLTYLFTDKLAAIFLNYSELQTRIGSFNLVAINAKITIMLLFIVCFCRRVVISVSFIFYFLSFALMTNLTAFWAYTATSRLLDLLFGATILVTVVLLSFRRMMMRRFLL